MNSNARAVLMVRFRGRRGGRVTKVDLLGYGVHFPDPLAFRSPEVRARSWWPGILGMNGFSDFYRSSIGKKIVVAVTGLLLVGFVFVHMLGNLQAFEGRGPTVESTKLNQYGELLRTEMSLLWAMRIGLLLAFFVHVSTTVRLVVENRAARPDRYAVQKRQQASLASLTMIFGGVLLAVYVVYHIGHFTVGAIHPEFFTRGDVYENVVRSFQRPGIVVFYVLATGALFFHLRHGFQSAARTLGASHPDHLVTLERASVALALLISFGFASVPLGVLFGLVK